MNILYVGDVMGEFGLRLVEAELAGLRREFAADLVIAQAENVTEGRGISLEDFQRLQKAGVDFCTGGNWTLHRPETIQALNDPHQPIIRPANYPAETPGIGWKYVEHLTSKVLVISLLGQIVGRDADKTVDNPLKVVDEILKLQADMPRAATIVNFHGDFSSEKVVIGHYLDGRVSAVIGDHWHVPTADARVLPGGTAHMTDVGMVGALEASLGVTYESVIPRWRDGVATRNILADKGARQFNAVCITVDPTTGLATAVTPINRVID